MNKELFARLVNVSICFISREPQLNKRVCPSVNHLVSPLVGPLHVGKDLPIPAYRMNFLMCPNRL